MSTFDLLATVLPQEGRFCIMGIGRYPHQTFWDTREEADAEIERLGNSNKKQEIYYGCAKYGDADTRVHSNAQFFQALWMDVDCGADKAVPNDKGVVKGYIDQTTGLQEVRRFCKAAHLPRPIIVDSGRGLHFYWILSSVISRGDWEPLSKALAALCVQHNLIVDPSVFEASRVLRPPGTFNHKEESPLAVTVISSTHEPISYADMKALLGASDPAPLAEAPAFLPTARSPLMEAMLENQVKRFKTIMIRSAEGTGCNQLMYCYENQATIDYNLWRSALSIATHCVDRDSAIHKMSEKHPSYSAGETEAKAADIGGPHHCATFESQNKGGCADCTHRNKIKSPIMLGLEITKSEEDAVMVNAATGVLVSVPVYLTPYFRGKNGGIYLDVGKDEGEPILVYENDLYVVKRMLDPNLGEVALVRFIRPREKIHEFTVPFEVLANKEELRRLLAKHGVMTEDKGFILLRSFFIHYLRNSNLIDKAEIMRTQLGWADNNSRIIIGDREITAQGTFYSPPSTATKVVADLLQPVGTLEKWKEVFNLYAAPGLEPNAFAALTGFGSLLLRFTGLKGAIINVIHSTSGSGKSTSLYMCNSIFGNPRDLGAIWKDTLAHKMHRLGVMNNLPFTMDEMTNTAPKEFSDLAYSISQGRGANRMKAAANEERVNLTSWQGITLASSNASFYEKLGIAKDSPDGESMRLLEYSIKPSAIIPMEVGKHMFDHQLLENYGHAGDIYAAYLVSNLEETKALLMKVQAKLDKDVKFTSRERFWSGLAACNIAGGMIAQRLGLHDFDMQAIYAWLKTMLSEVKEEVKAPAVSLSSTIGEYINNHMDGVLVVNGSIDARLPLAPAPILEPRGELLIRYEPDTKRMYLTVGKFKEYCVERQVNYKSLLAQLKTQGIFLDFINKRMSKGMRIVSPAVRVIELDTSAGDFINVDGYIEGIASGDRDS